MSVSQIAAETVALDRFAPDDGVASAPLLEISNAIVGLYKQAFGRGPTKARTQFAGRDTVLIVLEDVLTPPERTLLALGETERLRQSRLVIQEALEPQVRLTVEEALGRQTVAFVTGVDVNRGVAVNLCILEPTSSVAANNGDRSDDGRRR